MRNIGLSELVYTENSRKVGETVTQLNCLQIVEQMRNIGLSELVYTGNSRKVGQTIAHFNLLTRSTKSLLWISRYDKNWFLAKRSDILDNCDLSVGEIGIYMVTDIEQIQCLDYWKEKKDIFRRAENIETVFWHELVAHCYRNRTYYFTVPGISY